MIDRLIILAKYKQHGKKKTCLPEAEKERINLSFK